MLVRAAGVGRFYVSRNDGRKVRITAAADLWRLGMGPWPIDPYIT